MNAQQVERLIDDALALDTPLAVVNIATNAVDNSADTIGYDNRFDERGRYTEAFANHIIGDIELMICDGDTDKEARAWFVARGVRF